ncbi:MAG: multidrug efflux RND transporter permease subunit [Bacteroidales bacterium]|nr:multidrug efflux RND transporter permease subunit [Bacteroidales bacterium]
MSEFFIKRPIFAIVISILIVILGFISLQSVPIAKYPEITPPMVQITAAYNGANAVNMEQTVATPIEQQINGVEDMLYIKSINSNNGTTTIQVSFEVGTDLDKANMLTQNRVSQANPFLPPEVINMGINVKKSLTFPLLMFSIYSPDNTFSGDFISNYTFINLVDELKRIEGVGDVSPMGSSEYAMRVWLKPDNMSKLAVTSTDVVQALKAQNNIVPGGGFGKEPAVKGVQNTYTALLQQRLTTEEEFGNILIKSDTQGGIVRLKDIARIELGLQTYDMSSTLNGSPCSAIAIYQIPGANALDVANQAKKKMEELSARFPKGLEYTLSLDTTEAISAGVEEVIHTLFEAIILVILVVFIFLQSWRATLIPLLTVPVSLLGTVILFPLLGFSINLLSLLGMVLAIGLVVDDAIVVVEAVMHKIEHGLSPKEATRQAMKEVGGPVVAIAVILCAVFIPVAMSGGITGRLYQQFAITIAVSVAFSAFNALTLSPALAAVLLKPKKEGSAKKANLLDRFFGGFNRFFEKFTNKYVKVAGFFTRKLIVSMVVLLIICVFAVFFGFKVPGGFLPEEDEGYYMIGIELPDAASAQRTENVATTVSHILSKIEGIDSYTIISGYNMMTGTVNPGSGMAFISLKNWSQRENTAAQLVKQTNALMAKNISEATVIAFGPPPIPGLGTGSGFTMMLQDRSGNTPQYLAEQTQKFIAAASKRPEIGNIYTLYRANAPQKQIEVDVEKVQKLGLSIQEVNSALSTFIGGAFVNNFNLFGRQYRTYVQADAPYRMDPEDIDYLYIRDPKGNMIPLGTLVQVTNTTGPTYTNHFNIYRAAEISGAPAAGYSSSDALNALEEVAKETLASDMGYQWSNTSYQEKAAGGKSSTMLAMALVFVFLILAALYESWKLPFSVLMGTPWAAMGAFFGLFAAGLFAATYVNNVFAQIGLIMLIGLNAKNAILIVEFAKMKQDEEGAPAHEAALESAKLRFRPILMTSLAFILGVTPLMLASGAGAQARQVMGVTVFSGMIIATTIGVLLIPAFYVLIERKKKK